MDFVSDVLIDGRAFQMLAAVDDVTRERIRFEAVHSLGGTRLADALDRSVISRGTYPRYLRAGSEHGTRSVALSSVALAHTVQTCFVEPGQSYRHGM